MAVRLNRALRNIVYWLEAGTPTSQVVRNRWEYFDPNHVDCPLDSAGYRKFWIEYTGSGEDSGASDLDNREAICSARLHVSYPTAPMDSLDLYDMIASDRHDVRKILRDEAKYRLGYKDNTGTYATTATGIMNRWFVGDDIDKTRPDLWECVSSINFWIRESE